MFYDKFVLGDGTELQDSIVNVSWTTSSNSDSDIAPGSVCASAVEIEFWVNSDSALSITQGTVLNYYKVDAEFGIETKIGVFTCDKPEKSGANKYTVTAYDNITLLDVDVTDWLNNLTFPISINDFATSLAAKCNLQLANSVRLNGDYQVQKFTGSDVKGRDLMKMVCSASGCFCNADADGKLFFDWYKKNTKVVIAPKKSGGASSYFLFDVVPRQLFDEVPRALITTETGSDEPEGIPYFINQLTFSDFTVQVIDKVQVRQSDDDVGVIYPADEQGTNAIVIQGNQLLSTTSDAALRPYVKNLYDGLNDITYVPCSNIQTPETLDIKVGDIVTVSDGHKEFVTWITSIKHSGNKCTFESVGNANRNTTTAVNNAQYSARQKIAEVKASVDGISAKLGEYSTKSETEAAIDIALDKIELGISEKIDSTNFMDGGTWVASGTAKNTGSVTIESETATVVAPDSTESDLYRGVYMNMPSENLSTMKGIGAVVSIEYKVNSEFSATGHSSRILFWAYYASGNVSGTVVDFYNSSTGKTEPVGDWKTAKISFSFKNEVPTRIYFFALGYGGTGSVSVRNPSVSYSSSKKSTISLTKDGTIISASDLDLNEYAKTAEVEVAIDSIKLGITQENTYSDVDLGSTTWAYASSGGSISNGVLTLNYTAGQLTYGYFALPKSALSAVTAHKVRVSFDYRITNTLDAYSYVMLYIIYTDGTNDNKRAALISAYGATTPASDWKNASYEFELLAKDLSKLEITPLISSAGSTGSYEVKNVVVQYVYSYSNKFELTKDGAVISSSTTSSVKDGDFVTSAELNVKTDEITATVVKDGEVRSKFALDSSNCTISSGIVTFKSNTLVIDSTNFKLTSGGSVTITGTFNANNGVTGAGRNEINISSGALSLYRTNSSGVNSRVLYLYGVGGNASMGSINVFGNGTEQAALYSSLTGAVFCLKNAAGTEFARMYTDGYGHGCLSLKGSDGSSFFLISTSADGRPHVSFDGELECKSIKRNGTPL